jgi:hypothetical protein
MFGPMRKDVAGALRRMHNKEHHNLYASPNMWMLKLNRMRWAGRIARMGEMRNAYIILVGNPERKSPVGNSRGRWKDKIRMELGK